MIFATDDSVGKRLAKAQYLIYNLATTVVWDFEIGLTIVFHYSLTSWEQWLELIVAIYFLGDSAVVLYKWKLRNEHTSQIGVAVFVGFVAYLYATLALIRETRRRQVVHELRDTEDDFLSAEDSTEKDLLVAAALPTKLI